MKLSTLEFLKSGELPLFHFGTEKNVILNHFGKPDWIIENEDSSVLRFGEIEFHFYHKSNRDKRLIGIMILPCGDLNKNEWFNFNADYNNVKANLKLLNIKITETLSGADKESKEIRTTGKVSILFFPEDNKLCKAGKFVDINEL